MGTSWDSWCAFQSCSSIRISSTGANVKIAKKPLRGADQDCLSTTLDQDIQQSKQSFFDNQLLGYEEAAQYLSMSESYLRRLKHQGLIPYVPIGRRGIRFKVASLNRWISEREIS